MFGAVLPGGQSATKAEFILWKNKWNDGCAPNTDSFKPCNAFDAYDQCPVLYPNIKLLLQILCTLPVTSAAPERTFSMLWRLKSWLRSTMADGRLTSLACNFSRHNHFPNSRCWKVLFTQQTLSLVTTGFIVVRFCQLKHVLSPRCFELYRLFIHI